MRAPAKKEKPHKPLGRALFGNLIYGTLVYYRTPQEEHVELMYEPHYTMTGEEEEGYGYD